MSNPTELPDLGKLEALRRLIECAEILNKRPRPMCRDCADEDGTCPSSGLQCDMDALIASVKSLYNSIVLARRAQPEGEAPQAEALYKQYWAQWPPASSEQHSQSEPVAWAYECRQPGDDKDNWAEFFSRNKPSDEPYIRNVRPLYAQLDGGQEGSESNG